ncbi:MAG: ABC transporter permease [Actinomycetota bacterium]|nr:ABC transporter permease [Actinomycetota bacterium]
MLPFLLVIILGRSFGAFGQAIGFDYLTFVFTGVYGQTLFQSAALGLVSLLEDRDSDFSQELFVAPVSRYSILVGKILGEAVVALVQGVGIITFGLVVGVRLPLSALPGLLLVGAVVCLYGGAFGLLTLSAVRSRRLAEQLFGFVFLSQFLLAGVFNPVDSLPPYLEVLSRIAPMTYAVDLVRAVFYVGNPDRPRVVVHGLGVDLPVVSALFVVFLVVGTALFVRNERNR